MAMRSGYAVTIRGFIPIDKSDLVGHRKALEAVAEAKGDAGSDRDPKALFDLLDVEEFSVKPVQRKVGG